MRGLEMPDFGPANESAPVRVLVVSPGHPELDAGRISAAGDALVRQLQRRGLAASLLAAVPADYLPRGMRMSAHRHRPDEMLAAFPELDAFSLTSRDAAVRDRLLSDLLDHFQPDVVHFQHVGGVGLDACGVVRARGIPVVLTLQDDIAEPPGTSGPSGDGSQRASLFARRRLLQFHLADVDALVVPHRVLAERLAEARISGEQIRIIANPGDPSGRGLAVPWQEAATDTVASAFRGPRLLKARRPSVRQLHIGVFLSAAAPAQTAMIGEAMEMLPASHRRRLRFSFYRAPDWREEGSSHLEIDGASQGVGGLRRTIEGCDVALVPSLEGDQPLQPFQEAVSLGVPVLHPGRDDLPNAEALGSIAFDPDAVAHLAHCLLGIASQQAEDLADFQAARHRADLEAVDDYVELYQHLVARNAAPRR